MRVCTTIKVYLIINKKEAQRMNARKQNKINLCIEGINTHKKAIENINNILNSNNNLYDTTIHTLKNDILRHKKEIEYYKNRYDYLLNKYKLHV